MSTKPMISIKQSGLVSVDKLRPNPWNTNICSPEAEKKIEASMKRLGVFKPIICREVDDGLEILGGEHRWEVAKRLGIESVPVVNVGRVSDKVAKEIGLVDNARYGEDDTLALAELLRELGTADDLQSFLPYGDDELASIFASCTIDLDNLDLEDEDGAPPLPMKPTPTHQVMQFKVPLGDCETVTKILDLVMKGKNFTSEDSLTNAGHALVEIVRAYRE